MPTTFDDPTQDVLDILDDLKRRTHARLLTPKAPVDVTIKVLFAVNADGPALKLHGWPCAAIIKINNMQQRVEGMTDCTLRIDKDWWEQHDARECEALIDHELTHLEFKRSKEGRIKLDDLGRPLLRLRPHDFEAGGFNDIAMRHGQSAPEVEIVTGIQRNWKQMGLNFGADDMEPNTGNASEQGSKNGTTETVEFKAKDLHKLKANAKVHGKDGKTFDVSTPEGMDEFAEEIGKKFAEGHP